MMMMPGSLAGRPPQVVAAPTGSGKTGVMELAILRLLSKHIAPDGSFKPPGGAAKVVYLAPMRALVQEKVKSWRERWVRSRRRQGWRLLLLPTRMALLWI
jgi:ATP-dependent DNA helicase HFM1/MER3